MHRYEIKIAKKARYIEKEFRWIKCIRILLKIGKSVVNKNNQRKKKGKRRKCGINFN